MEAIGVSEGILCRGTYTRLSADDVAPSMDGISFALLYGTGPIVDKMLKEKGVDIVVVGELGPGAKTLLEMDGIKMIQAASGVKVKDALAEALKQI